MDLNPVATPVEQRQLDYVGTLPPKCTDEERACYPVHCVMCLDGDTEHATERCKKLDLCFHYLAGPGQALLFELANREDIRAYIPRFVLVAAESEQSDHDNVLVATESEQPDHDESPAIRLLARCVTALLTTGDTEPVFSAAMEFVSENLRKRLEYPTEMYASLLMAADQYDHLKENAGDEPTNKGEAPQYRSNRGTENRGTKRSRVDGGDPTNDPAPDPQEDQTLVPAALAPASQHFIRQSPTPEQKHAYNTREARRLVRESHQGANSASSVALNPEADAQALSTILASGAAASQADMRGQVPQFGKAVAQRLRRAGQNTSAAASDESADSETAVQALSVVPAAGAASSDKSADNDSEAYYSPSDDGSDSLEDDAPFAAPAAGAASLQMSVSMVPVAGSAASQMSVPGQNRNGKRGREQGDSSESASTPTKAKKKVATNA